MRQAEIYRKEILAGILTEDAGEYRFCNEDAYLAHEDAQLISLTLPLQTESFISLVLFPFFDGLIPEGWLLDVALRNTDISILDRMSLLLLYCKECIGSGGIVGDRTKHLGKKGECGHGLNVNNGDNIRIESITIKDFWGDCIYVRGNNKILISKCKILNDRRQGISVTLCKNNSIRNCNIEKVGGTSPGFAIDFGPNKGNLVESVLIKGNNVGGCVGGIRVTGPKSNPVMNAILRNCVVTKTVRNPYAFYNTQHLELHNCTGKQSPKPMKFVKVKKLVMGDNKMVGLSSPFQMSGCNNIKRIKR